MAGDPDLKKAQELLNALPEAGADIIELGFPFSDPMADGKTIQAAAGRALKAGTKLQNVLAMVAAFRKKNNTTPIILMGYVNPMLHYGIEKCVADAAKAGVDGFLIVDLPPEEDDVLYKAAAKNNIAIIKLATPTTDAARAKIILKKASGFVYYVSLAGITGAKSANASAVKKSVAKLKKQTKLPIAVGFGIKTPAQAKEMASFAEAVVVGSALVDALQKGKDNALKFVQQLRAALQP
jgi:tryptophan synthase alpha chain